MNHSLNFKELEYLNETGFAVNISGLIVLICVHADLYLTI